MRKSFKKMVIPSAVLVCVLSPFNLALAEDAKEATLDEVQVHSTALSDYLVTTEVITAEKIKEMGATNLAEAIKMVPGLYTSYAGKGSRQVRIRGAASDQTKIYIDGMPVFPMSGLASNASSNLETIPADNIEKIEIIKGPGPVQYGTDYKGGIILITTKSGKGPDQTSLNLSAGSNHSLDNSLTYTGSNNNTSYYITAGRKQSDGYLNNSAFDTDYFNGKIKWKLNEKSDLTVSGYYMNTDRQSPNGIDQITGEETTYNTNWSGDTAINGTRSTKDWKHTDFKQTNLGVQFDQRASNTFKYNVKVYHLTDNDNLWVYNANNASLNKNTYSNPLWYRSGWYSKGDGIEFTGDLQTSVNNTITFGAKYNKIDWTDDENDSNLDEGGTDKRTGYYFQDNWMLDNKTNLTMGVRHDQAKQSYYKNGPTSNSTVDSTDPVFNITRKLNAQNTLRFSAGKSHMFVTAKQAASNINAGVSLPGPEKATNYEIGWKHDFDERSSLDIAAFQNNIDDRIDRNTDKSSPLYMTYYNILETEIKGVELQYNRNFTKRLKGFVNYTYLDSKDTDKNGVKTRSTNLPEYTFNYGFTYAVDKFEGTVLGQVIGNSLTSSTTYPKLESYHTVDLDLKYHESKNLDYYLHIYNLFDTKYWEKYDYPGDGINFMAGVTMKL